MEVLHPFQMRSGGYFVVGGREQHITPCFRAVFCFHRCLKVKVWRPNAGGKTLVKICHTPTSHFGNCEFAAQAILLLHVVTILQLKYLAQCVDAVADATGEAEERRGHGAVELRGRESIEDSERKRRKQATKRRQAVVHI